MALLSVRDVTLRLGGIVALDGSSALRSSLLAIRRKGIARSLEAYLGSDEDDEPGEATPASEPVDAGEAQQHQTRENPPPHRGRSGRGRRVEA